MTEAQKKEIKNVAVYGTLKRGHHANDKMRIDGCAFLGSGVTTTKFRMTDCGYPMLERDDGGNKVAVEVYANPDFQVLDWYEGVPHLYTRDVIYIQLADGTIEQAWIYIGTDISGQEVNVNKDGLLSWPPVSQYEYA